LIKQYIAIWSVSCNARTAAYFTVYQAFRFLQLRVSLINSIMFTVNVKPVRVRFCVRVCAHVSLIFHCKIQKQIPSFDPVISSKDEWRGDLI